MSTISSTRTAAVTHTDAKYVKSKIHADLRILRTLYGGFTAEYETNTAADLYQWIYRGYASAIEFVYYDTTSSERRFALTYRVDRNQGVTSDGDPGSIPFHKVVGASFNARVTYSDAWKQLGEADKQNFYAALATSWGPASPLRDGAGYWTSDRSYASGALGVSRAVFRPY